MSHCEDSRYTNVGWYNRTGITSGRSSRPQHHQVLYFPHRHLWTMEYSCKVWCKPCRRRLIPRQHSRHSWRLRLVAFDHRTLNEALSAACRQEGEMEQYLEEKKASQKRPAATFQRQDKKKTVYQTPQRTVAVGSSQIGVNPIAVYVVSAPTPWTPTLIPASNDMDANFSDLHALQSQKFWNQGNSPIGELSPNGACWIIEEGFPDLDLLWGLLRNPEGGVVGDVAPLEETVETDSERGD
ncbi:hypothetical protein Taro_036644 [Colocasia esculenta]|uniref:Uncharacterized protein n=1 Tax=Colocasia esculenta TaxID=4460 RepID=A0A843WDY9_COLES|nr:hypothetical protein [Colocasia esculenta]